MGFDLVCSVQKKRLLNFYDLLWKIQEAQQAISMFDLPFSFRTVCPCLMVFTIIKPKNIVLTLFVEHPRLEYEYFDLYFLNCFILKFRIKLRRVEQVVMAFSTYLLLPLDVKLICVLLSLYEGEVGKYEFGNILLPLFLYQLL